MVVEVAKGVSMKIARRAVAEIIRDSAEARAVAPEGTAGGGARARRLRSKKALGRRDRVRSSRADEAEAATKRSTEETPPRRSDVVAEDEESARTQA